MKRASSGSNRDLREDYADTSDDSTAQNKDWYTFMRPRTLLRGSRRRLTSSTSSSSASSWPTRRIRDAGEAAPSKDCSALPSMGWAWSHNFCHDVSWFIERSRGWRVSRDPHVDPLVPRPCPLWSPILSNVHYFSQGKRGRPNYVRDMR